MLNRMVANLREELADLDELIGTCRMAATKHPNDFALQVSIESLQLRRQYLETETVEWRDIVENREADMARVLGVVPWSPGHRNPGRREP